MFLDCPRTQQTNTRDEIDGLSRIQTRDSNNRVVADLSLRPHGQHYGNFFIVFVNFRSKSFNFTFLALCAAINF